jgi:hypothetical protein
VLTNQPIVIKAEFWIGAHPIEVLWSDAKRSELVLPALTIRVLPF